ncbi:MAG: adenylyl-sulfate kinase [Oligoflexia bacterium]|nr:adenylyl-sulfate kinase [Oligoflexia bacterium]
MLLSDSASPLRQELLCFSTAGSVDDGKSTLLGRLLYDTGALFDDQLSSLQARSKRNTSSLLDFALVTDGLKAEQEQGITIDVAYRYFSTLKRRFILVDSPGHEQYTRNMATAASNAELTIILIDASKGVLPQTKRHAFISALMRVPRVIVAVNKMDLVDYRQEVFDQINKDFLAFANHLNLGMLSFIPISALHGDNVAVNSRKMPWYQGSTVLEILETAPVESDLNQLDLRVPIQCTINPSATFRGYGGKVCSGVLRVGCEVTVLPSQTKARIHQLVQLGIDGTMQQYEQACAGKSVTVVLDRHLDVGRGSILVDSNNIPETRSELDAMIIWMSADHVDAGLTLLLKHASFDSKVILQNCKYKIDCSSLKCLPGGGMQLNEIARWTIKSTKPMWIDPYERNRAMGSFILIDPISYNTVGAGMIIDSLGNDYWANQLLRRQSAEQARNLHIDTKLVEQAEREELSGVRAKTYWLTGLSGSGKSSIARALERALFDKKIPIFHLDGDYLRSGLNRDLGFSIEDRGENVRRTAEVAKLFNEAGMSVICSLVSPFRRDRAAARSIIGSERFVEIYLDVPLQVCEARDPHGLYKKARKGEIPEFTGIGSPYEPPLNPALKLDTANSTITECVARIIAIS